MVVYNHSMPEPTSDSKPEPKPELASAGLALPPPAAPPPPAVPPPTLAAPAQVAEFHIGDEFGTAKRNLPPVRIVLICLAAVAVVVGIFAFTERAKPQGAGAIDFVSVADVPGQNMVLSAITLTLRNTGEKPLWIHSLKVHLVTADNQTLDDEAASAVDLDRYYQAFPVLKQSAEPPLSPETKLQPGAELRGTIVVGFKLTKDEFDQRKSLTVAIQPYDQPLPIILK